MGLREQLRSVIEWTNPDPQVLFFKWTDNGDEIKNCSKLIVGPGQGCIFVYEGKVRGVYQEEGLINLETDNVPFWTTIKSTLQNMQSEHKVGIYYFRRAEMVNVRWGTPTPIKYLDPQFRFPVGLGAFGNFSMKIIEAESFFKNIVAGQDIYTVRTIQTVIVPRITPLITDILGKAKFSYIDVDGHRAEISAAVLEQVAPVFAQLGFQLTDFRIEGTNFDEDTQRRIGRIADMAAEGQAAAAAGIDYAQMQQLEALKDAAKQQNSIAGLGMGLSAGVGMGQMLGQVLPGAQQPAAVPGPAAAASPPPAAGGGDELQARLLKLKSLFDAGLLTEEEFTAKKKEILADL